QQSGSRHGSNYFGVRTQLSTRLFRSTDVQFGMHAGGVVTWQVAQQFISSRGQVDRHPAEDGRRGAGQDVTPMHRARLQANSAGVSGKLALEQDDRVDEAPPEAPRGHHADGFPTVTTQSVELLDLASSLQY